MKKLFSSIRKIFTLNPKSGFSLRIWKSEFWNYENLKNLWNFVFTINPYTSLVAVILVTVATVYMTLTGSDGYELLEVAEWLGIFWIAPGVLTYLKTWINLAIKKQL